MALGETLRLALDTLRAHKLRSFLTLLGVILAVTTLVAVMSVVEGLNRYISDKVANLGANAFVVDRFGIITSFEEWTKAQKRPPLEMDDYLALRDRMELAQQVGAASFTLADVRYGRELSEDVNVQGVTSNYLDIRAFSVSSGRFLNETDEVHRSPVCVLGPDVVTKFFLNTDPVGKSIRVGPEQYEVIGVTAARGTIFGQSQDNFVMIPLSTYLKSWQKPRDSVLVFVQARHTEQLADAQDEARVILRSRRHIAYKDPDSFGIIAPSSLTGIWERLTGNVFAIAIGLTSVFMVVGGIVIMNIMLASVTERTREIGIRKSLGARRRHITIQFLIESAVLAAAGGVIGIVLALTLSWLVRTFTSLPIRTQPRAIVLALTLSTVVGLFFGIYPALRASRLSPIEALRVET